MTNHPRRLGRRKQQRQAVRAPAFSPFPCPFCRGATAHEPNCQTHWSDVSRAFLLPPGTRLHFTRAG